MPVQMSDLELQAVTDRSMQPAYAPLTRVILVIFAVTCGFSVANIYYAQPLLDAIAAAFDIATATVGLVITLTQVGYAIGLLVIVPLGDLIDRRKLVIGQCLLSSLGLFAIGLAPNAAILFAGMIVVGFLSVTIQVLVAFTATLATPEQRGRAVGFVTSGVVIGVLTARSVSGIIADLGGWRAVFLVSAVVGLTLCAVLHWRMPRDVKRQVSGSYFAIVASIPGLFLQDPLLRSRALLALLIFASASTLWTSLVLPLTAPPLELSLTQVGLFGLAALAGAFAATGAGRLADRGWAHWTTGAGLVLLTLAWLPIGMLHQSLFLLALGVIMLDLALQAVHVTNQTLIFAIYPEARSRLVGGYMFFYSIGVGAGAIASTSLYAVAGWTGVSLLGAAISVTALLVWAWAMRLGNRSGVS